MTQSTEHFDALSSALFGGTVKAADLKIMPGNTPTNRESRAKALLDSMMRLGIVKDGCLINLNSN
jgi:hypothetical protein